MYIINKSFAILMLFAISFTANAAGFALIEQGASGLGNAYAGGGAVAQDASTIFFNPAGMTYIKGTQAVGAIHLIKPNVEFNDNGTSTTGFGKNKNNFGGDAGGLAVVPNMYFKTDVTDDIQFGLGIYSPFGLKTEYSDNWIGRFQAIKSDVKTININPALSFKVSDQLSLGFGVSALWAQAELTNAVNFGVAGEGTAKVKGDDIGFGYNLGAIYQITPDTRLSIAYRSKIDEHLKGEAKFNRPTNLLPAPVLTATANGKVKAELVLPESVSMSGFTRLNEQFDLMGDVTWTRWSRLQSLTVYRTSGALLSNVDENWNDTLRYSVGLNYHHSDTLTLRAGAAYDNEAIPDANRTARIPGNDRKWLSVGAGWKINESSQLDVGYAHLFVSDAKINRNELLANGKLSGDFSNKVDILSVQYTYNF